MNVQFSPFFIHPSAFILSSDAPYLAGFLRREDEKLDAAHAYKGVFAFSCGYSLWLRRKPRWVNPCQSVVEKNERV
ncbi:MAG: hypothetical protein ACLPYZ_15625 [Limisphaerales bacterium]